MLWMRSYASVKIIVARSSNQQIKSWNWNQIGRVYPKPRKAIVTIYYRTSDKSNLLLWDVYVIYSIILLNSHSKVNMNNKLLIW